MNLKLREFLKQSFFIGFIVLSFGQESFSDELEITQDPNGAKYYSCSGHGQYYSNRVIEDHYSGISSSCVDMWVKHAKKFGMRSSDWKKGWGFNSCTEISPLKRVLKSLELIHISKNSNLSSRKIINYMYSRAARYTKKIKPKCSYNSSQAAVGSFRGGTMKLYSVGIRSDLIYLTSIITHEARHRIKGHDGGNNAGDCTWGGSCDSKYSYYGANAYELAYSWAYGVHSTNSSRFMRQRSLDISQYTNQTAFVSSPNFNIPVTAN